MWAVVVTALAVVLVSVQESLMLLQAGIPQEEVVTMNHLVHHAMVFLSFQQGSHLHFLFQQGWRILQVPPQH
jgi:hypothetical protein